MNVAEITVSTLYDGSDVTDTLTGLTKMRNYYGSSMWNYTTSNGIDLHHALLHRYLGGGRATLGAICDPEEGFGISGGIVGTISNIGSMYWDLYVFAHEVG